ncbi:MAG: hypothetical protein M9899_08965 [Bdellovibrionaceae bacterium]|nr:hypothetical protein [Pseudobdellovibrionaceae bacterium]
MGKKSAGEATNLFRGLDDVKVKPSKQDELGVTVEKTATKNIPDPTLEKSSVVNKQQQQPPGLSPRAQARRKAFEDIDPVLGEMLVHPEATVSKIATAEELAGPVEPASPRGEKSKLNVIKSEHSKQSAAKRERSVVAHIAEEKTPVPVASAPSREEAFDDKTQKIQSIKAVEVPEQFSSKPTATMPVSGMGLEDQLRSANYLELAQNRVLELEKEVQKLRRDNEQLSSAGQHFKELTESIKQQLRQSEANFSNLKEIAEEEKKILTQSLEAKEIKIGALQERLIELEEKINSSFDHVRIRERELENRLEIMKTESDAVMSSKDEMILDLKKQLNLVNSDLEKYRIQNQKITTKMEGKEELLRRTVKALRIALTMLEGSRPDEDN